MGEGQGWLCESRFNRSIKIRQADRRVSSNGGALLLREVDHQLGLTADLGTQLHDDRDQDSIRYTLTELLRQHLYGLTLGYRHQDDHDVLAHDIAMQLSVWDRPGRRVGEERLASQPSDWRLVDRLSTRSNRHVLREALSEWVGRHQHASGGGRKVRHGTLDLDPFPIEVHGNQPGGAYHGHYHQKMYYPLVASFSAGGDHDSIRLGDGIVHAILRRGNAGPAEGMVRFARRAIAVSRKLAQHLDMRIDAGLVNGKVLDAIDDEKVHFVGRIKANAVLDRLASPYLHRAPGRPTKEGDEFTVELGDYQAEGWTRPYRVVLVVIDLPDAKTGMRDLFPRHFFLVTNWRAKERDGWTLLEHYRQRGTFEDRLGEFNATIGPGLSANTFEANETCLLLKLLAFNLVGIPRAELEATGESGWDLKRVQQTVLKTGVRVVEHARRWIVDLAAAVAGLWTRVLKRIGGWRCDQSWGGGSRGGPRPRHWVPPPPHAHRMLVLRE